MAKESPQKYAWSDPKRTAEQVEADLAKTRERLAGTLSELEARIAPGKIPAKVKGYYVGEDGPRWDHIAITIGATAATLIGIRTVSKGVRWVFGAPRPVKIKIPSGVVYVPVAQSAVGTVGQLEAA